MEALGRRRHRRVRDAVEPFERGEQFGPGQAVDRAALGTFVRPEIGEQCARSFGPVERGREAPRDPGIGAWLGRDGELRLGRWALAALGAGRTAGLARAVQADVDHLAAGAADRGDRGADQADHLLLPGAADGEARRAFVEHDRDRRDIAAQRQQEGGGLGEPVLLADEHHHRRRAGAAGEAGGALGIDRFRRGERDRGIG